MVAQRSKLRSKPPNLNNKASMSKMFLESVGDRWQNRLKERNQWKETVLMSSVKIDVGGNGKENVSV